MAKEGRGDLAVCLKSKMIGQMLVLENDEEEYEIGYVFNPAFWNSGYAKEECIAALSYNFGGRKALRVIACVREGNLCSLKILNHLGFSETRSKIFDDGVRRIWYALTQENWMADQQLETTPGDVSQL